MSKAWTLSLKEWKEILRDFYVLGILVFLPLAMVGTLVLLTYFYMSFFLSNLDKIQLMLSNMPKAYLDGLTGYSDVQKIAVLPLKIIGLPFFLLIPLLISGIITSDSFAGERERNTLEPLLAAPIRPAEVLAGKILTPFLPGMLVTWASFALFTWAVAGLINPHFISPVFPDRTWIFTMALVVPLFLLGTVLAQILISMKAASVKAASALNMLLSLPVLFLMLLQSSGFVLFSMQSLTWIVLTLTLINIGLFLLGLRFFRRLVKT